MAASVAAEIAAMATDIKTCRSRFKAKLLLLVSDGVGEEQDRKTVPGFTMNLDIVSKSDKCTSAIYVFGTGDNVLSFRC